MKLSCQRHAWLDTGTHEWQSWSSGCYDLPPGTEIKLEKWDDDTYVHRTTGEVEVHANNTGTDKVRKTVDVEDQYRKTSD
jgi:hypothetical protein